MSTPILKLVSGHDRAETTNLIVNPSFETDLSNWSAQGSNTIARSNEVSEFGAFSLRCTYEDNTNFVHSLAVTLPDTDTYVLSVWVYIPSDWDGGNIRVRATNFVGATEVAGVDASASNTDTWIRIHRLVNPDSGDLVGQLQVRALSAPTAGRHIYIEGAVFEKGNSPTPYCDGDQPGCVWTGTPHASTSTRTASSRTTINLLTLPGFALKGVSPMAPEYRGGGVYRQSPFADGRRLVDTKYNNVIENYTLAGFDTSQDRFAQSLQELRQLLVKAAQYWTTSWQDEPVWLEAKGLRETNTRYALIMNAQLIEEDSHWSQPFLQPGCVAVMDDLDMVIERGPWLSSEPGIGEPVAISAVESYHIDDDNVDAYTILDYRDDGEYDGFLDNYVNTGTQGQIGNVVLSSYSVNMRFDNLAIPPGANITSAIITVTAAATDTSATCNLQLAAEFVADPSFIADGDELDFLNRSTGVTVDWDAVPSFTATTTYNTPDISAIIQQIVDQPWYEVGQAINIYITDNGSSNNAHREIELLDSGLTITGDPILTVTWADDEVGRGNVDASFRRSPTSRREVFVANKRNVAQITDIYVYDATGPTWSQNLVALAPPYNLLPDVPAAGDYIYFGIDSSLTDSGPFNNLIFDIGVPAVYTGAATLDWEYYGGSWSSMIAETDRTADSKPFDVSGVNGFFFRQPAMTTVAVNGVTGYWVRAAVNLGGGTISTVPTQQNRDIYSVVWPYVEIQASELAGGLKPKISIDAHAASGLTGGLVVTPRIVAGSRSISRGENFTPVINLSDEQNPDGITVAVVSGASFQDDALGAPSGRDITLTSASTAERFNIVFDSSIAHEYRGRFRSFLRANADAAGGPGTGEIYLVYELGSGGPSTNGETGTFSYSASPQANLLIDLGVVNLFGSGAPVDEITIHVYAGAAITWDAVDLWLMPVDEWAIDIKDVEEASSGSIVDNKLGRVDEISSQKYGRYGLVEHEQSISEYEVISAGPAELFPNEKVRLYFFQAGLPDLLNNSTARFESVLAIQMNKLERFFSLRGSL